MRTPYELRVAESVHFLQVWAKENFVPEVAIVMGSGLSGIFPQEKLRQHISYNDLPGFKTAAVKGHAGELGLTEWGGVKCAVLKGRVHAYEGYDPGEVVHNLRALMKWGAKKVILTNACGCLNEGWNVGEVMAISDQINGTGLSPLAGVYGSGFGQRFVDMCGAYSPGGVELVEQVFASHGQTVRRGVYFGVHGPAYESPAEVRMYQSWGADAVGMSTVLETLAARQMGVPVLGLACFTNFAAGLKGAVVAHEDVLAVGKGFEALLAGALPEIIKKFSEQKIH